MEMLGCEKAYPNIFQLAVDWGGGGGKLAQIGREYGAVGYLKFSYDFIYDLQETE